MAGWLSIIIIVIGISLGIIWQKKYRNKVKKMTTKDKDKESKENTYVILGILVFLFIVLVLICL